MSAIAFPTKKIPLSSKTLSMDDIKKIYDRLMEKVSEDADREIKETVKHPGQTEEEFQEFQEFLAVARKQAFRITITITGGNKPDEISIFGDDKTLFDNIDLPEPIRSISMNNITAYSVFTGRDPQNSFDLSFDFEEMELIDNSNPVSSPTPNNSCLHINGRNSSWNAVVEKSVMEILENRSNRRSILHKAHIFDVGLWVFFIPFAIYLCANAQPFINKYISQPDSFISASIYIYIFFMSLWGWRIMFGYARWAFPVIELEENSKQISKHRGFWYVIVTGIIIAAIWQVLMQIV